MADEIIAFAVQPEDRAELDRLVAIVGGGDRSEFLREAVRVMAIRERAERLGRLQAGIHAQVGGPKTSEQVTEDVRHVVKGK
ncbi:hypothetical protein [Cellulomonas cellasea]|uniref:Metal-responsive CopG/Arc/MetJ family transcriptional regulator n=1 Tax=Cellulomonas cellasea TaxID=43670 RepID=A0A7W4UFF6_9CELL|nr:hypothetical protein [Cellulomonas cellasea]MBB2923190.1 metal-responsive CopG/Arc/MetJ family transcriptional regulator [Cellulomonas cellasea]